MLNLRLMLKHKLLWPLPDKNLTEELLDLISLPLEAEAAVAEEEPEVVVEAEASVVEEAEVTGAATEADKVCYSLDNNMSWRTTFLLVGEREVIYTYHTV